MSYFNINIDALESMITEYKNLRDSLKKCGNVLSQSVINIPEMIYAGSDASFLRKMWGIQSKDTIPTLGELLDGVIVILEDSLAEYKECKLFCNNMLNDFENHTPVNYSVNNMHGDVLCDVDKLELAKTALENIGIEKEEIAETLADAIGIVKGLNYSQNDLLQALEDLAEENVKLNQYSLHYYRLNQYIQKVTDADDNLCSKLMGININLDAGLCDEFVPKGQALLIYSPEAIKCAMILSKTTEMRTEKEKQYLDSVIAMNKSFDSSDYKLIMSAIGGSNLDIEWDNIQAQLMAEGFQYALDNNNTELMLLFYSNALVCTGEGVYFGDGKLLKSMSYIDCDTDPTAYFTLVRDSKMRLKSQPGGVYLKIQCVDGIYVLDVVQCGMLNDEYIIYHDEPLQFINMYDEIPDEALYNIRNELHMNHDEEIAFLSSFYSDEDVDHLCNLASISKGDTEALENFFATSVHGVTPAFYTALADYTYHLDEYGTKEYAEQLERVSNSIMTGGGHDGAIMIWDDNASFYYDALYQGFKARFDDANIVTAVDFKISDNDKFVHYGTLSTLFNSEYYMYQNGYNSTTFLGSIAIDFEYNNSDYATIYNNKFTGFKFVGDDKITYSLYFEVTDRLPEPNSVYEFPVTVYGEYNNQQFEDGKILQNMKNIQWRQTTFPYRAVCAIGSEALGYTKFDEVCPTVSKGGDVLGSISVVKGLYDEYNSFDEDMQKSYREFFCNKTGWRTGFVIGDLDNDAVPLGNFSPNEKNHVFVVISEPYSPLGYIISEEINNGLLVEDFTEDEKEELINKIGSKTDDAEKQEVMKSILFGGFDREEYLKNHSVDEYTSLYEKAIEVYDEELKKMKGTTLPSSYQSKINERYEELYHN